MRKIRFKPVAAIAAALAPLMVAAGVINYTATYDYSKLTLGTDTLGGVTYTTVNYDGLKNGGAPGMPSLPIDYLRFSVPYNATNFSVTASIGATVITSIGHLVYPCQAPCDTTPMAITLPDSSAYYTNTLYPSQRAWVVDEGFLAGENHIVTVAVMPIAYKHSSSGMMRNSIRKSSTIQLTLNYNLTDSPPINPIIRESDSLRNKGYELTQSLVVNADSVEAYAPLLNRGGFSDFPNMPDDPLSNEIFQIMTHPYLIVTTSELSNSVRRIAALKKQKGYNVKVVTIDQIMRNPMVNQGDVVRVEGSSYVAYSDSAGVLRQFLKNAYKYWGVKYVILNGNIPYRMTTLQLCQKDTDMVSFPSDLYYGDLNGDWSIGQIDYQPELFVGRIIAKNEDQICNYSDKLFRYELNPGNGDRNYLDRIIYSVGYDMAAAGELQNARYYFNRIFSETKVLRESSDINDTSKFPSGKHIIDSINARQYGFISFNHHGFPGGLLTYGFRNRHIKDDFKFLWAIDSVHIFADDPDHCDDDPSTGNGLNNMNNRYYPSVCYSTSCSTIPYNVLPGYELLPMNLGESFTTGKGYGGPAFIGNTNTSYTPSTGELELLFGGRLYNNAEYNIGIANGMAKSLYYTILDTVARRLVPVVQNLLGDPEFEIWTDTPEEYSNITVTRLNNSISISGISGADSTIVAYTDNNGNAQTRVTSSETTFNNVSPNGTIMLYKHNYIPYIAPLFLQNVALSNSQYVIASDVTAGESVDSIRTPGYVTVKSGVEYEIEASGTVTLSDGFSVEKGATFAVYPSSF
jgi:hypothetical protein